MAIEQATSQRLLTLDEASQQFDLSTTYLALLLRREKVAGQRVGQRLWLISEPSLQDFLSQPRKPGPKRPQNPS